MKIVRVVHEGTDRWGWLTDDRIELVAPGTALAEVSNVAAEGTIPSGDTVLVAPIEPGAKIMCVGLNYRDHVVEMGREMPEKPVLFTRFADSLVGSHHSLLLPSESDRFDYEGEFAVVIGREGRRISAGEAVAHVLGYTILNDGSLRDYQRHTTQFTPGKNFFASGSVGPWIMTTDEFGDVGTQRIRTSVNGELRQDSTLDQLVFGVAELIEYISSWTPLRPGDIIATGTPGGVADGFNPPRWMRAGDEVTVDIDGLGALTNTVVDD